MNKSIQSNANGIVDKAKQTVANVAADAKEGVSAQLEQRIDQAKQKIDDAKGVGVEKIETVSDALRGASQNLEGTGPLPQLAEKAAEGIENLAHFIENKSIGDVVRGIEGFAKRQPGFFLGGAVAVGILAGRFLKSSARRTTSVGDSYETYGFEGNYGSEGTSFGSSDFGSEGDFETDDYLSADDLEEDWDNGVGASNEPMAFQSESDGIGLSGSSSTESSNASSNASGTSDWSRTTQPQGSSFGDAQLGSTRGNTEKMPATQGSIGGGTADSSKSEDFGNKSSR
jgi:hypothetical protein